MGIVYSNNFSSNSDGFSGGTILTSPSGENFLGPFTMGGSTTLTITNLAPHTTVDLSFTLDVIGTLDGDGQANNYVPDPFVITLNGTTIFNYTFANYPGANTQSYPVPGSVPQTGAATVGTLGYSEFPADISYAQDTTYNFTLSNLSDSSSTITLVFTGNSNEVIGNEFYGIDNVLVSTNTIPVITSETLSNGKVTLTGSAAAEANDIISVYDGSTLLGITTTDSHGTWSFTTKKVSNAAHFYTADATDLAGDVGHSGNEAILGSSKNDTLVGTSGNDIIIGNGGNDRITGGGGADLLTGGSGKVTFIYNAAVDSTPAGHDTITDFTHGHDKIDFSNIAGINTFQGKLTGSGNLTLNSHSVAYIEVGGNTVVLINTTNVAEVVTSSNVNAANMEIDLVGTNLHLTNSDFLHS